MIRSYEDNILFTADSRFEDTLDIIGHDGSKLKLDTSFDLDRNARIHGTVVSVPVRLSKGMPIGQDALGFPAPSMDSDYVPRFKFLQDISMEVEVGDTIYFNYKTLRYDTSFVGYFPFNGEVVPVYKVKYDSVYCSVRNKKIIPIGGHVLLQPDLQSFDERHIPTYSDTLLDQDGNPQINPKEKWIQINVEPEGRYLRAYVKHIGTPLKGWSKVAEEGDLVVLRKIDTKKSLYPVRTIEGEDFIVTRQRMIEGKITDEP
jgi:hypothetical protein